MMIGRFKCAVAVSLLVAVQIASTKNNKKGLHAVHKSDQRDAELDLEPPSEKKSKMANDRQTLSASQSKMANDRQMSSVFQSKMASASQSAIINHIFDLLGQMNNDTKTNNIQLLDSIKQRKFTKEAKKSTKNSQPKSRPKSKKPTTKKRPGEKAKKINKPSTKSAKKNKKKAPKGKNKNKNKNKSSPKEKAKRVKERKGDRKNKRMTIKTKRGPKAPNALKRKETRRQLRVSLQGNGGKLNNAVKKFVLKDRKKKAGSRRTKPKEHKGTRIRKTRSVGEKALNPRKANKTKVPKAGRRLKQREKSLKKEDVREMRSSERREMRQSSRSPNPNRKLVRQENRQNRRYKSLQDRKHNIYTLKKNQRRGHSSKKNERGHSLSRKRDKYRTRKNGRQRGIILHDTESIKHDQSISMTRGKRRKARDTTQQEVDVVQTQGVVEGRGHVIKMLDLGSMAEGNRADAIALTDDVSGVLSSGVALLILSLWITLLFHLYQAGFERRSEPDYSHYFQQNPYNRYYGNRQKSGSITERMSRLLDNISSNSIKRIVDSLDPRPSISRIGEGAVNSVEGIVSGTLDQGASIVSQATEVVSLAGDLFNGGASRVSKSVEQISAKDCLLQSMCYLSAPDTAPLIRRMLDTSDKFEGRRKKNKKNKEHKKNKKNKKKNKNKVKIEYYDDDDIFGDEDEDEKEEKDEEEDEENEELAQKDCEVFRCTPVRLGHGLYQLYNKIQEINSFSSNSIDDY